MDAVVLCGGKGTRLASVVSDVPKPLAPVHGRPFLDYVLDYLLKTKVINRFILATGHLAHKVEEHYGREYCGVPIEYSREAIPLGTAGAAVNALRNYEISDPFLLLNGDSFVDADIGKMRQAYKDTKSTLTLALFRVEDTSRFGTVAVEGGKVTGFLEKTGLALPGLINSGVYLISKHALAAYKDVDRAISLETEVIPSAVALGCVGAVTTGTKFIDIGLPETYRGALDFFER